MYEPGYQPSEGLNSSIAVLLQELLRPKIAHEGWFDIN